MRPKLKGSIGNNLIGAAAEAPDSFEDGNVPGVDRNRVISERDLIPGNKVCLCLLRSPSFDQRSAQVAPIRHVPRLRLDRALKRL